MGPLLGFEDNDSSALVVAGDSSTSVTVVLRDNTGTLTRRTILNMQSNHTVEDLITKITEEKRYPRSAFDLSLSDDDSFDLSEANQDLTLSEILERSHGSTKVEVMISRNASYEGSAHNNLFDTVAQSSFDNSWSSSSNSSSMTSWTKNLSLSNSTGTFGKSRAKYVGLSNQGATCYMNSLLQSLFMTPEFREGVYKIPVVDDVEKQKDSICFQLQNLFAQMQMSDKRSVETKGLTKSFGWDGAEAFQQHDVQELCRVLFEEIEERLKGSGTEGETLIKDLFEGTMESYVRNMEGAPVKFESIKEEPFMDISLSIRQFGVPKPIGSIDEGLGNFIKPETLDGNNQYQLDPDPKAGRTEKMMVDANKGLQFADFPYILTLQLKRFDFDYNTMRRIKISDKVTFPEVLDMEPYLAANPKIKRRISFASSQSAASEAQAEAHAVESNNMQIDEDESSGRGAINYELYSVMVHSGSAFGGHYYAYIKSFEDGKWYKFNDATVSEASWSEVEQTFGGSSSGISTYSSSWASAYMLMYRKIDKVINRSTVAHDRVPEELTRAMQRKEEEERLAEEELRNQRNRINLTVHHGLAIRNISIDKSHSLYQLIDQVKESFPALSAVSRDCMRLRKYHTNTDVMTAPVESDLDPDPSIDSLQIYNATLAVETRPDTSEPWLEYDSTKAPIKVWIADNVFDPAAELEFSKDHVIMHLPGEGKVMDLKKEIMREYKIDVADQVLARANRMHTTLEIKLLESTADRLKATSYIPLEGERFFVARIPSNNPDEYRSQNAVLSFSRTPMHTAIDKVTRMVRIVFNLINSEEYEHYLDMDSSVCTLEELKEQISRVIQVGVDEFRIYKMSSGHKTELTKLQDKLANQQLYWGGASSRIFVERGVPLRPGVHSFKIIQIDTSKHQATHKEIFSLSLDEELQVVDIKKEIAKKMAETSNTQIGATNGAPHIRVRDTLYGNGSEPRTVLIDELKLGGTQGQMAPYYSKTLDVQVLQNPEPKTVKGQCVVELIHWHPSSFTVGPREEIVIGEQETIEDVRTNLSKRSGIEESKLMIGKSSNWIGTARNELEGLTWQEFKPRFQSQLTDPAIDGLSLREGELYYFKDRDEELKELSEDEKKAAQAEVREFSNARKPEGGLGKEKALRIKKKESSDSGSVSINSAPSNGPTPVGPAPKAADS